MQFIRVGKIISLPSHHFRGVPPLRDQRVFFQTPATLVDLAESPPLMFSSGASFWSRDIEMISQYSIVVHVIWMEFARPFPPQTDPKPTLPVLCIHPGSRSRRFPQPPPTSYLTAGAARTAPPLPLESRLFFWLSKNPIFVRVFISRRYALHTWRD